METNFGFGNNKDKKNKKKSYFVLIFSLGSFFILLTNIATQIKLYDIRTVKLTLSYNLQI